MEGFCNNYGFTPEQYRGIDDEDLEILSSIMKGRGMAKK